jgi:hypothetical protein
MYTPKYFTFKELVFSSTATNCGIDNTPTWEYIFNMLSLCEHILDPLREAWKYPIKINSCFRSQDLNNVLSGASDTSVHRFGKAADLWPIGQGVNFDVFVNFTINFLKEHDIKFDQLIVETNSKGQRWLHIGEYSTLGLQRGQIKNMYVK